MNRGRIFSELWGREGGIAEPVEDSAEIPKLRKGDGCLFTSGSSMQKWCCAFKERHGHALPDSFPILGIDGKNRIDPNYEQAPSISVDWQMAGRYALEVCMHRIDSPGAVPKRIYLPGKLCE